MMMLIQTSMSKIIFYRMQDFIGYILLWILVNGPEFMSFMAQAFQG